MEKTLVRKLIGLDCEWGTIMIVSFLSKTLNIFAIKWNTPRKIFLKNLPTEKTTLRSNFLYCLVRANLRLQNKYSLLYHSVLGLSNGLKSCDTRILFFYYRHFLENQYIKCQWEVVCGKENHNFFLPWRLIIPVLSLKKVGLFPVTF